MGFEDSEPTTGDLTNSPSHSVDPQQSPRVLAPEHPDEPHAQAYGSLTAPSRVQSPSRVVVPSRTATQGTAHWSSPSPPRVASITATQGCYSPRGIEHRSESHMEVVRQEYSEFITLKDNAEVVLAEAMEATEQLNTVFSRIRASMNRMSPRMKELFLVPANQASGKMLEPGNNQAHDRAAAQAATQRIIDQITTHSRVPGDWYFRAPLSWNIPEDIPHTARGEQGEDSQPRRGREAHTVYACDTPEAQVRDTSRARLTHDIHVTEHTRVNSTESTRLQLTLGVIRGIPDSIERSWCSITEPQSMDMNALREEIKSTISATIKEKLHSDADSVTTVSQSMQALDTNAQYWSDLSNKAARRSHRALELQLKLAEEKVNTLLHEEAPEEALLEAAWEARTIRFQLDQNL
ncbi:hypothetical protein M422DRAFT_238849 [Sphaerobolus stellatus SS14]|nr:hypothetical protein M422DRAFT_238849 [Sphaerobolus stellatus SS14]